MHVGIKMNGQSQMKHIHVQSRMGTIWINLQTVSNLNFLFQDNNILKICWIYMLDSFVYILKSEDVENEAYWEWYIVKWARQLVLKMSNPTRHMNSTELISGMDSLSGVSSLAGCSLQVWSGHGATPHAGSTSCTHILPHASLAHMHRFSHRATPCTKATAHQNNLVRRPMSSVPWGSPHIQKFGTRRTVARLITGVLFLISRLMGPSAG